MAIDRARLARTPTSPLITDGWRHLSPGYDPLSGEGARIHGGRFNPPNSFPVLYVCRTRGCAVAELRRLAARQALAIEDLLPRHLYRYAVQLERVLDLCEPSVREQIGVSSRALTGPDWTVCQSLGLAAHELGIQAIVSPSATGVDAIIAVFVRHLGSSVLEPTLVEEWRTAADL